MSNFCEPLLAALKDCVLHSDCVMKEGRLPSECIKHHIDELPEECRSLRLATFECKRGMVIFSPPLLPCHPSDVFFCHEPHSFPSLICGNVSVEIVLALPRPESSERARLYKQQSYPEPQILRSGYPSTL